MNTYVISDVDRREITRMLDEYRPYLRTESEQMTLLRSKLEQAVIVPAGRLSRSVVTMNSVVSVVDLGPREESTLTLVYPRHASVGRRRVSVLSPLGAAILGCEEGSIVEIALPVGSILFTVRRVLAQPDLTLVAGAIGREQLDNGYTAAAGRGA